MHFFLDANMPRRAADVIVAAGHQCTHVRDTPLASAEDETIAAHVRANHLTLITRDFDFADVRKYPPERYDGMVVLTVPDTATASMIAQLVGDLLARSDYLAAIPGRLAIVEFGRIRLRPRPTGAHP